MQHRLICICLALCALALQPACYAFQNPPVADPQVNQTFEVPYFLTKTNHFVVRALINGKGPFNLVVDTGAPGLFLGTDAANKSGVKTEPDKFFSNLEELKLEGGPILKDLKIRVEDPFQLTGMNSLGLPGMRLDGLMGFSVLARYRITLDPTHRRMFWTRLNFNPKQSIDDVPVARKGEMPVELQALNMLGPAMKIFSLFIGKQPETKRVPQGFAGFAVKEQGTSLVVSAIMPGSPAAKAGLELGDHLLKCNETELQDNQSLQKILQKKQAGARIQLTIKRNQQEKSINLILEEAF